MKLKFWSFLLLALLALHQFAEAELDGFEDDFEEEEPAKEVPPPTARRGATLQQQRVPIVNADDIASESMFKEESVAKPAPSSSNFDQWDEDEFEGIPPDSTVSNPQARAVEPDRMPKKKASPPPQTSFIWEKCTVVFLVLYAINYLYGKRANERIAKSWADTFTSDGGLFHKNFALIGPGGSESTWRGTPLMKESPSEWSLYASGRLHCECLNATLALRRRQDLYSYFWYLMFPYDDTLTIDVTMNPEAMEKMVFLLAPPKITRAMAKEKKDLEYYVSPFDNLVERRRRWPISKLSVLGETWEVANELVLDSVVESVMSEKGYAQYGKYLQYIYISDDNADPVHKANTKVLSFQFNVPPVDKMKDLGKLIDIVPRYIDAVAHVRLSAAAKAKSESIRNKVSAEAFKQTLTARQELLWKKKQEKKEAEREAEANLSKEAIRKRELKEKKQQLKKSQAKMKITKLR